MRSALTARAAANGAIAVGTLVSAVAIAGCRSQRAVAGDGSGGSLAEEACVAVPVAHARCFRLAVPENRKAPGGRTISLRIVVLPATASDRAADPIFHLAGGPGQAATALLRDPSLADSALRRRRDLVFADQRGTGGSNPLTCRFYGPPEDVQSYFDAFLPIDKVRACRAALEAPPTWRSTRQRRRSTTSKRSAPRFGIRKSI